jgi:hypothetical protein
MRDGISIEVCAADRERLAAVVAERNSPQNHVWRAWFILATAEGCGTLENRAPRRRFQCPACSAGKRGSCAKASRACCATGPESPACRRCRRRAGRSRGRADAHEAARRGGIVPEMVRLMDDGAGVAYRHPVERDGENWLQEVRAPHLTNSFSVPKLTASVAAPILLLQ